MAACTGCASTDDLYLVTSVDGAGRGGRVQVLCAACRDAQRAGADIAWPLHLLTPGTFLELFRTGKAGGDPRQAVQRVFGAGHDWIATEAADLLEQRRLDG